MHRDQVYGVPAGADLLASTDKCPNQGYVIPGRVITVQGHPEFTEDIMGELLEARHATGILTDDVYNSAMERRADEQDGVEIGRVFLRFLQAQPHTER